MKSTHRALAICSSMFLAACGAGDAEQPAPNAATTVASTPDAAPPVTSATASATATAAGDADAGVAPPPALQKGNITGVVKTTPANGIKGGGVVFLEDAPKEPGRGMASTVDNVKMSFQPYITIVTAGGTVKFENTDPFPHNVFSPKPDGWDIGVIPQHGTKTRVFDKPGFFTLLCNLHPNMIGYIVVTPSSYYALVDAAGKFTIKDVPAGSYKVSAWVPRLKETTQPVTVAGDVTVNLEVVR